MRGIAPGFPPARDRPGKRQPDTSGDNEEALRPRRETPRTTRRFSRERDRIVPQPNALRFVLAPYPSSACRPACHVRSKGGEPGAEALRRPRAAAEARGRSDDGRVRRRPCRHHDRCLHGARSPVRQHRQRDHARRRLRQLVSFALEGGLPSGARPSLFQKGTPRPPCPGSRTSEVSTARP